MIDEDGEEEEKEESRDVNDDNDFDNGDYEDPHMGMFGSGSAAMQTKVLMLVFRL